MIVGFTCGTFDLLHPGHVSMLRECSSRCDVLVVGLHTDPTIERPNKNKPIQSTFERYLQLEAVKWVDKIIPYDTERDLENLFATLNINKRFVGSDHLNDATCLDICNDRNIEIVYTNRDHDWSSTELRDKIEKAKSSIL
jgi:glycerol-3-phosphate cytidylyltransferase